mgnify:CR=1 FL=1
MSRVAVEDLAGTLDVAKIRPLDDHVLVRMIERERTVGGVWLPKSKGTECALAEVVRVGRGIQSPKRNLVFPLELEVGDIVLLMEYSGERLLLRGGEYRLMRSHGIWARVMPINRDTYELADIFPRAHHLVVEVQDETTTMSGSLYLPNAENAQSQNRLATVVKVGPGVWDSETGKRVPIPLAAGDRVVMMRYAGANVFVNGKTLRILDEEDIRCATEGI